MFFNKIFHHYSSNSEGISYNTWNFGGNLKTLFVEP
jgi:hypothetical protein